VHSWPPHHLFVHSWLPHHLFVHSWPPHHLFVHSWLPHHLFVHSWHHALEAARTLAELLDKPLAAGYEEDIHIAVERHLSQRYPDVAAMLSFGKSRNDAVVAAVKIRLKERVLELYLELLKAAETLLKRCIREAETIFPVYTHLQRAMPATYGFVLASYALRLIKTIPQLKHVLDLCSESPLGSAAAAGTDIILDRRRLAGMLGFEHVSLNALEATASRDFILSAVGAIHGIALILSSLAEEMVIYSSEEFGLLKMPEELAATSSVMPQKRNPVVAEIMRTKAGETLGIVATVSSILARQPSGYSLDLQQVTPKVWYALDEVLESLRLLSKMAEEVEVDVERAYKACLPPTAAVFLANYITLRYGLPFRKAHGLAGRISRLIAEDRLGRDTLAKTVSELGLDLTLSVEEILEVMEPRRAVKAYVGVGSANPSKVVETAELALGRVAVEREWAERRREELRRVLSRLLS
ncbi:MAG: argininosuccinate lyase, partial [Nitrososphaerota archaeon]